MICANFCTLKTLHKKERIGGDEDDDLLQFSPYWGRRKGLLVINVTLLLLLTRLHSPDLESCRCREKMQKYSKNSIHSSIPFFQVICIDRKRWRRTRGVHLVCDARVSLMKVRQDSLSPPLFIGINEHVNLIAALIIPNLVRKLSTLCAKNQ